MTKKELIDFLEKYDDNTKIIINDNATGEIVCKKTETKYNNVHCMACMEWNLNGEICILIG